MTADIVSIGLLGPGISDWPQARSVLCGSVPYVPQPTLIPVTATLPPAERRRAVRVVNLAVAVAHQATKDADVELASLPGVFASSVSDSTNCHELLQTLATVERQVSPTRFHNSVPNVTAGYWSIATKNTATYTMVCAYDGSFAAGLVEALSLVATEKRKVMLVAYDLDYPMPLREKRAIGDAFAVALLLRPAPSVNGLARLACSFSRLAPAQMRQPQFESLRVSAPAARALPLLEYIAIGQPGTTTLEYLDNLSLAATVTPCV